MSGLMDDPNRECLGLDPAWVEGSGGEPGAEVSPSDNLDSMTKAQLLDYAAANGVEANDSMTKADIRQAIDEAA